MITPFPVFSKDKLKEDKQVRHNRRNSAIIVDIHGCHGENEKKNQITHCACSQEQTGIYKYSGYGKCRPAVHPGLV
jgi:hypothetical protein